MNDSTVEPDPKLAARAEQRAIRLRGRHALRSITTVMRCFDCGREPNGSGVEVRRTSEGVVGFAGLVSCGRVWLCPVCNARVMARRAVEVGAVLAWATARGYSVIWGSLTARHNAGSDLGELLDIQRSAWRHVVSSKGWRSQSIVASVRHAHSSACPVGCVQKTDPVVVAGAGRVGYIRCSELTIGVNGWHPHFHPIIIYRGSKAAATAFAALVVLLWVEGVEAAGGEAREVGAQMLRVLGTRDVFETLNGYVTKATYDASWLAMESTWSQGKTGRGRALETVSHWSLLAAIERGEADEVERWQQLEEAIPAHRIITYSRGLRRLAGLGVEATDEQVAAEEVGTRADSVCFITPDGWGLIRDEPRLLAHMLARLEVGGWAALREVLDEAGVEYLTL